MCKGATALRHNTVIVLGFFKDPSQPLLFSMRSKVLILHVEAKSCYKFAVSCVLESMSLYLQQLHSDFLCFDMLQINMKAKLLYVNKTKSRLPLLHPATPVSQPVPFTHLGEERHYESTNTISPVGVHWTIVPPPPKGQSGVYPNMTVISLITLHKGNLSVLMPFLTLRKQQQLKAIFGDWGRLKSTSGDLRRLKGT